MLEEKIIAKGERYAKTPRPPYYAVIFCSTMKNNNDEYQRVNKKIMDLAEQQPGYLGMESARSEMGITVSYWANTESIRNWKQQQDHLLAQAKGKSSWYKSYKIRVAKVERDYGFGLE